MEALYLWCKRQSQSICIKGTAMNHDSATRTSESCQEGSSLSTIPVLELDNLFPSQSLGTVILASKTTEHGTALSTVPENVLDTLQQNTDPDTYLSVSHSDQEKSSLSMMQEKVLEKLPLRRNPNIGVQLLQSVQEGSPRTKKQVERTHEGNITNINCRGNHEHPKPQQSPQTTVPLQTKRPEKSSLTRSEDKSTDDHKEISHQIVLIETPKPLRAQASVDVTESSPSKSNKTKDRVDQDADPDSKRRTKISERQCKSKVLSLTWSTASVACRLLFPDW
ncbi:WRKY domain-containing protein [Heracleum sosnowskyi]|uniref:WRKY domain-containing protein n=1 Tax=Heracleum sosnowskyi TaxID=360622 RepID=A0AAD8JN13_9APIA|nr:WRKY domain-containing protein [Heracleum sosnowskyi]